MVVVTNQPYIQLHVVVSPNPYSPLRVQVGGPTMTGKAGPGPGKNGYINSYCRCSGSGITNKRLHTLLSESTHAHFYQLNPFKSTYLHSLLSTQPFRHVLLQTRCAQGAPLSESCRIYLAASSNCETNTPPLFFDTQPPQSSP